MDETNAGAVDAVILCIGAFLDFTAGQFVRAPLWMQRAGIEWTFRLLQEPRRMASRYLVGNATFLAATLGQRMKR